MIMKPARTPPSAAVSADNTRQQWLTVSLLAGSLALLAWCAIAL
jgi:hypothetical protein